MGELLGIPGAVLVQGGAAGALAFVVLAIVTGRLVPRRVVEDVRADRDARLADRDTAMAAEKARGDEWRAASLAQDARNDLLTQHVEQLLESSRTTNALLEGMKQVAQEKRR